MKILVTGGDGQLARCIMDAQSLYDKDNVYVYYGKDKLDISNSNKIRAVLVDEKPDLVVNCAAYTKTDNPDEKLAFKVNALGPIYLAMECKGKNIALIHISTDYVFDGEKSTAYAANDECSPKGIYGMSKYCGEEAIKSIYPSALIIRTSWLYSEYGNNFLTKTLKNIYSARLEGKKVNYVVDQIGCPTYAPNLARFIVKNLIVEREFEPLRPSNIYHFTDSGVASRYDFAKAIEKAFFETDETVQPFESYDFVEETKRPKVCILGRRELILNFNCELKDWRTSLFEFAEESKCRLDLLLGLKEPTNNVIGELLHI